MFAMLLSFDAESPDDISDGIEHVKDEVIPALEKAGGVTGWWLVDRDQGRRVTLMVWNSQEEYDAGMTLVQQARSANPDRHRPAPSSVGRFEIYGSVPAVT